jgi:cation transport ATPase
LFNAMAVLLVACPCAMGLATPVAIWSALARLSRIGLVARTADVIDVLARADVLCIDKTGTLSTDALAVRAWSCEPGYCARQRWLKSAVVAAEEGLAHPVAQALRATFPAEEPVKVLSRRIEPGSGVVATVSCEGREVELAVGERVLGGVAGERAREERGKAVYVFCGGALVATIELEEKWRLGLRECFSLVNALGLHVEVLSGDPLAESGLGQAGTESGSGCVVRGGLTPGQMHERVASLVAEGRVVVFVGDGLNDAAAMSASHVSIAMSGGTELARASAGAVFVGEDLRFLPHAISVARAARKSVRLNLFFAAGYNGVGVILAALGWLHPVVAALLMVGSSAFVSVYALRAGR